MTLKLGDTAPDFEADSTQGKIRFHDWMEPQPLPPAPATAGAAD